MILILGAGLSGLSASYHLGHGRCLLLEKRGHAFGHVASELRDGLTWDTGPHVSFTRHEYVRELFREGVQSAFHEIKPRISNYFRGHWIDHPAQTSMYQIPQPERGECLSSFRETRRTELSGAPLDYQAWLDQAFGPTFARLFPVVYTDKYWTVPPAKLTTEWIGKRVHYPTVDEVERGAQQAQDHSLHYVSRIR